MCRWLGDPDATQADGMKQPLTAGDRAPHTKADPSSQTSIPDPAGPPPARLLAGSPAAILAIVPHLLGFVPESSIVVIGTEPPKGEVKVTLRYDLPDPADADLAADIGEHAVAVLRSQRLTAAIVVGYGPDRLVRPLAVAFSEAARDAGIELRESLRAEGGRYWSYTCRNETCCPAVGTAFDAAGHAAAAAMTGGGPGVMAGRGSIVKSIAPLGGIAAESMREATRRAERHVTTQLAKVRKSGRLGAARQLIASEGLAAVAEMIKTYRAGGRYATDYQLAWLTVAMKDLRVRDDAWARMDPGYGPAHRRMWTDVVRRAQPGHVAAPASLLAFVAWQGGNGALANVALDRALADDPGYSMALLLRQVITAGAPPSMARLPLTPEEVAASYDGLGDGLGEDTDEDTDEEAADDTDEVDEDNDDAEEYEEDGLVCAGSGSPGD
jgi:Domain of unknown function (DUF4192)